MKNEPKITTVLLPAVLNSVPWLARFNRMEYSGAFRDYREQFSDSWLNAVRAVGEEGLPELAESLLDGMHIHWAMQRVWNRTTVRLDIRQMMVESVTPRLLMLEDPGCRRLAELLHAGWADRRPKEVYQMATYQQLESGFRFTIMGIPVPEQRKRDRD